MHSNDRAYSSGSRQSLEIRSADHFQQLTLHADLPVFPTDWLHSHQPDSHWVVLDQEIVTARCSLWWRDVPHSPLGPTGLIGHYAAIDESSAACLLPMALSQLHRQGCKFAIGPMDQNTWRDYRVVTAGDSRDPFFMEPTGSVQSHQQFLQQGFREVASYSSSIASDLSIRRSGLDRVRRNMDRDGICVRAVDEFSLESDLRRIYPIVCQVFRDNAFYVPVQESDFIAMYLPLKQLLASEMVLVAAQGSQIVAFCFAVPDLAQQRVGQAIDTIIFKTFGALPHRRYGGIGQVLMEEVHRRASDRGFRYVIHALMRDPSPTQRMTARYGKTFRRYALLGRELAS